MSGPARDGADPALSMRKVREHKRRQELFGKVADLPRPDLISWLRGYTRRHPEPRNPRAREARRWLRALEGEP
ncbi:MAG: hypothetical protein OYK82_00965 [Gammaproteobacteria bacterium]|nr:hypothetical protein [Gammaproteobacteria bacterium]